MVFARGVANIRIYEYPRIIGQISRKYSYPRIVFFYTNIRTIRNTNTSWIQSIRISIRITIRISLRGYEYFVDPKYPYKYSYKMELTDSKKRLAEKEKQLTCCTAASVSSKNS